MSTAKTILLITGGNTGVGYQIVKQLLLSPKPYHILLGGRSPEKVQAAIESLKKEVSSTESDLQGVTIDIESDESIADLTKEVEQVGRLDVLVNNAGGEFDIQYPKLGLSRREMFAKTYDVNVTGTHLLTEALAPYLIKGTNPRLLFTTSGTASFAAAENKEFILNKVPEPGWPKTYFRELPAYKSSKVAVNMIMRDWERILRADNVKVWCVNPGFVATGLGGDTEVLKKIGARDPEMSGKLIVSVIEGKFDEQVGYPIAAGPYAKNGVQAW